MNEYCKQIEAALQTTVFHSPTSYSWFGVACPSLSPTIKRALAPETARNFLLLTLQRQLYNNFYRYGFATPVEQDAVVRPLMGMTPFVEALSTANSGNGYWDEIWTVRKIEGDNVVVWKEGLELWVRSKDCLVSENSQIAPDIRVSLRLPKDLFNISPGFYVALSNRAFAGEEAQGVVRFYWNFSSGGAVHFMQEVTTSLNQAGLPFQVKILKDPKQFTRCDPVILYIRKNDYKTVSEILSTLYPLVAVDLKPGTPAFTKRLAAGLGLAEDPGQGASFGEHRCHILAEGMLRAYEQREQSLDRRLQVVEDCFAEAGISLEKPYLNPGSEDYYHFQPQCEPQAQSYHGPVPMVSTASQPEMFLHTAHQIGQRLVQEALWYQDQCNWLGASYWSDGSQQRQPQQVYRALGPELYDGTSGIALFLAELYAITRDAEIRQTALGAIRQALARVDIIPPIHRMGLYSGWMGIALAAARIGAVLGEGALLHQSKQLAARAMHEHQDQREFDLIYGNAGAIVALLVLQDMLDDTSLLDFAMQSGDELLITAQRSVRGYSWNSSALPTQRNLTGLPHGTAGMGYALLELYQATGTLKYRSVAEGAFDYERHWFDADARNWPDFRQEPRRGKGGKKPSTFAISWCHGAPGIALARLRAYHLLKKETYKVEAEMALQTTHKMIEAALLTGRENFSLCHGLAGNAEVLLEGIQEIGQEWTNADTSALDVARHGIETAARSGGRWLCGTHSDETPGMLLGLAGIGYFYLRLYHRATPSILLLRREHFLAF